MKFDISEKLAMVNVIDSVIVADGKVHKGEINALSLLMKIGFSKLSNIYPIYKSLL